MGPKAGLDTNDLVYGGDEANGLVVIPRAEALRLATVVRAVGRATTWGQLRSMLPAGEWEEIVDTTEPPGDDDPFSPDDLPGWNDGDYPDWPQRRALQWMPTEIIDAIGDIADSRLNGEFIQIATDKEEQLLALFKARGVRIERDDELAMGASRWL